jgi:hypothetical protein
MPVIDFEGEQHEFPDDFTDADIAKALASVKPAAPAAADPAEFKPIFDLGQNTAEQIRQDGVLGRGVLKGVGSGFLGLPALASDAAMNAAYGAKKLASKTGLVDAPDPKNYYGTSESFLPATSAVSGGLDAGLDAAGLPKAQTAGERIVAAGAEGIGGGVGGFLAGRTLQVAGNGLGKAVGGALAAEPAVQAGAGAVGGVAGQATGELADTPLGRGIVPDWAPAAVGMLGGAAAGAGLSRAAQRGAQAAAPTIDQLTGARDAAYTRARGSGVEVQAPAFARLHDEIRQDLDAAGIFRDVDPGPAASRILQPFTNSVASNAPVPLDRVEAIRKNVGGLGRSLDPTEQRVAGIVRQRMDGFLGSMTPADVIAPQAGAAERALGDLREGRALHARVRKATALDNALESGELRAGSTGSGANGQNTARQNLRPFVDPTSPKSGRLNLNPEEAAQARAIVQGGAGENMLRGLGKLAPTGAVSAIPSALAVGATGATGLAVPAAGYLAKGLSERIQARKVERLRDTVRRGSALPEVSGTAGAARGAAAGFLAGDPGNKRRGRYR